MKRVLHNFNSEASLKLTSINLVSQIIAECLIINFVNQNLNKLTVDEIRAKIELQESNYRNIYLIRGTRILKNYERSHSINT